MLNLPLFAKGKVREVYDLGNELLIVASDRISAFDYVLPTQIPDKGKVLNQISAFWFRKLSHVVENHMVSTDIESLPKSLHRYREVLEGRAMLVKKTQKILIECVVRGYLAGSGWKEYKQTQSVCGVPLPHALNESDGLPQPIFTPATKEEGGKHDINIPFDEMARRVGKSLAGRLMDLSLKLYTEGARYAESKGIILADTKFEFGLLENKPILIDEVLTPDSSRFWKREGYSPGKSQDSFDKQFVRDYLEKIHWNKEPPVPGLAPDIVRQTRAKYIEAYERLTGEPFRA